MLNNEEEVATDLTLLEQANFPPTENGVEFRI